jgi:PAS domain S-box-containing protein
VLLALAVGLGLLGWEAGVQPVAGGTGAVPWVFHPICVQGFEWVFEVVPRAGLSVPVVGLASQGGRDDDLETLAEKVEQLNEGDVDVDFTSGRTDAVGRLSDALDDLAASIRTHDRSREESEHYRQQLYQITSDTELSDEAKIDRLLELGCERLGVENGHVVRVDEAAGRHEIVAAAGSDFVTAGTVSDVSETFCRNTISSVDILDIYDASETGYEDDPAYRTWDISCYVGGRIEVGDELWGTVCFVDEEPQSEPFTPLEKTFVDLITRWLSHLLERRKTERTLREEKERFESLVQEVDEYAIFLLDTDGCIRSWNAGAERINGYEAEDIVGEHVSTFYTEDAREAGVPERNLQAARRTGSVEAEGWRVRNDGSTFWANVTVTALHDDDGDLTGFTKVTRDMTERREYERRLERERDRFSALFENTGNEVAHVELPDEDGSDIVVRSVNARFADTFGYDEADVAGRPLADLIVPEGQEDRVGELTRRARRGDLIEHEVTRVAADGDREFLAQFVPIGDEGTPEEGYAVYTDITARKRRERALEALHEASRALLTVGTDRGTAELVAETAAGILDVAGVGVYLLDEASNTLEPVAATGSFAAAGREPPAISADGTDSLVWDCYVTETRMVVDDPEGVAESDALGAEAGGGLLVPIGDHGVFVVTTRDRSVDDETRWLVETLVATAEAAFDRIRSEESLRESDAELETRNRRLQRQMQIDGIIRRIDQSLIGAGSREEIEAAVCEGLVEAEDVAFAWIGSVDPAGDELEPSAWAGGGESYLDAGSFELAASGEPAALTAASEEPTVVGNVVADLQRESWRKTALSQEFHSVVCVPLAYEEYFYGVLAVYADQPDAFTELEGTVFAELGETIAHSINAAETQQALHADTLTELSLRLEAEDSFLGQLAARADCEVDYEGLATYSDEETRFFLTTTGADSDVLRSVLDDLVAVSDYRIVVESDEADDGDTGDDGDDEGADGNDETFDDHEVLLEVVVAGSVLPTRLVRHGGHPRSIRVSYSETTVVVDVPTTTDVREFVEMLQESAPSLELEARRSVERATRTRQELVSSLFERLTDRQVEVLRTAYHAGFFEWPRESTGQDVAEMLDVSQPTVNRHLRLGQDRLLDQLFDAEPTG